MAENRDCVRKFIEADERLVVKQAIEDAATARIVEDTDTRRLAAEFSKVITGWLTAEELAEVARRNATPAYAGCCATHDFCDANEAMIEAYEKVTGRAWDLDVVDEADRLIDRAWDTAKAAKFDSLKITEK